MADGWSRRTGHHIRCAVGQRPRAHVPVNKRATPYRVCEPSPIAVVGPTAIGDASDVPTPYFGPPDLNSDPTQLKTVRHVNLAQFMDPATLKELLEEAETQPPLAWKAIFNTERPRDIQAQLDGGSIFLKL